MFFIFFYGDTKYTFGENNNTSEKYKTEEKQDENVVNQPRVTGSKTYEDTQVDAQDNWSEIELYNVDYTYDDLGRISSKNQNKGVYTYSYLADGQGALLPNIKNIAFAFGKNSAKKWTYAYGYDNRGNLSAINLTKTVGGQNLSTTYTYDAANRLSGETIKVGGTTSVNNSYYYQGNGKGKLIRITDQLDSTKSKEFYYDGRGRIDYYCQGSVNYKYTYDNYGNVLRKTTDTTLYSCAWERGNLLKQVTKGNTSISYNYNHRCVRFKKTVGGITTDYYLDGAKILGESRTDGKELRYFYDHDGLMGFKYGSIYYGYVKDGQDNIVAIVKNDGSLVAQYEYDSFGRTTVKDSNGTINKSTTFIGNINPFRWKSFYYDAETGFYYANGRYYEVDRGGYIDAIEADIIEGNAYNVLGLDRNGIMLMTLLMLAPYSETIATALQLYADPTYDPNEGVEVEVEETPKSWWKKHWWEVLIAAVNIVVGVVKLATGNPGGILNIISGICTLEGAICSEQLAGAMGTATLGVQTIMIGVQSLGCNPVYGIIAMAVGAACVAFATAEAQESLGYGNWLKDTVGMSDEAYNGVMIAVNIAAIAINIVGVKQCFKEGTLVACLNENGEEIRKPIESIAVGTLVLAYDEESGEKAYKPVVQLFRNTTKEWQYVYIKGEAEPIISTPGHKYYLPNNTVRREEERPIEHAAYADLSEKWVSAYALKKGDIVLLSDGRYGIIEKSISVQLSAPETTYNLEVEEFHTYFVGENPVCVHNAGCSLTNKQMNALKKEVLKGNDINVKSKDQALEFINKKFPNFQQEVAGARSSQGWHFDCHPINGSINSIEHINLYSKTLNFRVHITWQ